LAGYRRLGDGGEVLGLIRPWSPVVWFTAGREYSDPSGRRLAWSKRFDYHVVEHGGKYYIVSIIEAVSGELGENNTLGLSASAPRTIDTAVYAVEGSRDEAYEALKEIVKHDWDRVQEELSKQGTGHVYPTLLVELERRIDKYFSKTRRGRRHG